MLFPREFPLPQLLRNNSATPGYFNWSDIHLLQIQVSGEKKDASPDTLVHVILN